MKKRILITAGPTREFLDPVRYLTNPSSGDMGLKIAQALQKKGAQVTVILGPTSIPHPSKIKIKPVVTALQMHAAVKKEMAKSDAFIATAAVGDYRFARVSKNKIKKGEGSLKIKLVRNPDILKEVGLWKKKRRSGPILVGFALETKNLKQAAARKLRGKNLDLIIGNDPSSFSEDSIKAYWLERGKTGKMFGRMSKKSLAEKISKWIMNYKP